MKLRIGIDIGSKGAIAFFMDGKLQRYAALPLIEGRPDLRAFSEMVLNYLDGSEVHAVIEDLHSIYQVGAASNFQFGWINGATEAILTTLSIPYTKVSPRKWQKEMWEGIRPVMMPGKKNKVVEPLPELLPKSQQWSEKLFTGELESVDPALIQTLEKQEQPKVDTKATSLLAAKRLFPEETFLATTRSKVPHDGIVDAVLIGLYCVRKF